MEAPTRTGAKENGPTASSAPNAAASALAASGPSARSSTPRNPPAIFALRTQASAANRERIRGGTILGDAGIPVNQGRTPGPFGPLFVFLVTTSRGP